MRVELARLSRHRLKEVVDDSEMAIAHLAKAGVLTRRFAAFLKKTLRAATTPRAKVARDVMHVAPDALDILRIVPNRASRPRS
jgi:hypothetical protein